MEKTFIILLLITSILPFVSACIDSDRGLYGGLNYYERGSLDMNCSAPCGVWADQCMNSTTLLEYYCDGGDKFVYFDCPHGCENGACIINNSTCIKEGGKIRIGDYTSTCCSELNQIIDPAGYFSNCGTMSLSAGYVCTKAKCGDGKCELKETKCNCPEDCDNPTNSSCKSLYWFDNNNKECGQKQFCGAYMYLGLQTFESKLQCIKALNPGAECIEDNDCTHPDCGTAVNCIPVKSVECYDGKCKMHLSCPSNSGDENGKCMFSLSNRRKAEIKIMPETASARAIERLGDLGFTIELKEVGKGDDVKPVYELTGNKQGKFLGVFKIMARVQAQVDAEDGKVKVIKPWWSFLASGI